MNGFSENWPDGCPPKEAEDADGLYFRIGKSNPPADNDFKSHEEMGKQLGGDECMRRGLSVFGEIEDARHLMHIFPKIGSYVYSAQLQPKDGKIKPTPSRKHPSHITWWPYSGIERASLFRLVGEV